MLDHYLNTTSGQGFSRQKHGCALGSPASPIDANMYMEEVENGAFSSFTRTVPRHWFRYCNTWCEIAAEQLEVFSTHLKSIDKYVRFVREDIEEDRLKVSRNYQQGHCGEKGLVYHFTSSMPSPSPSSLSMTILLATMNFH